MIERTRKFRSCSSLIGTFLRSSFLNFKRNAIQFHSYKKKNAFLRNTDLYDVIILLLIYCLFLIFRWYDAEILNEYNNIFHKMFSYDNIIQNAIKKIREYIYILFLAVNGFLSNFLFKMMYI